MEMNTQSLVHSLASLDGKIGMMVLTIVRKMLITCMRVSGEPRTSLAYATEEKQRVAMIIVLIFSSIDTFLTCMIKCKKHLLHI